MTGNVSLWASKMSAMQRTDLDQNPIVLHRLKAPDPGNRHEFTVRRFSDDHGLLVRLRGLAVAEVGSVSIIEHVCRLSDIPFPDVTFHGRRGPHTGFCQAPRDHYVLLHGEDSIQGWERTKGRRLPENGMIRLGRMSSLATIAHECGHHLVHHQEAAQVASHGKVWVRWFDAAAHGISDWLDGSGIAFDSEL